MRGRILRILLFLLVFFLINHFLCNLYIKKKLFKSRHYKLDLQYQKKKNRIKILALGDSHVSNGFDPRVFKHGFNFSTYGENYIYNYYKLNYVLKTNKIIKIVVLPIDLHTFSTWRSNDFRYDFYWKKYLNYFELGLIKGEFLRFIRKYIVGNLFPYIGEFEVIFKLKTQKKGILKKKKNLFFQGFIIKKGIFEKERDIRSKIISRIHFYKQKPFDKTVTDYFKKIIKLCFEKKVNLILIKFPVSKIYYKYASKNVNTERFYKKIQSMIKKYNNIRLFDFHELFFKDDKNYFYDPHHLNRRGAKIFSTKIREELIRLKII